MEYIELKTTNIRELRDLVNTALKHHKMLRMHYKLSDGRMIRNFVVTPKELYYQYGKEYLRCINTRGEERSLKLTSILGDLPSSSTSTVSPPSSPSSAVPSHEDKNDMTEYHTGRDVGVYVPNPSGFKIILHRIFAGNYNIWGVVDHRTRYLIDGNEIQFNDEFTIPSGEKTINVIVHLSPVDTGKRKFLKFDFQIFSLESPFSGYLADGSNEYFVITNTRENPPARYQILKKNVIDIYNDRIKKLESDFTDAFHYEINTRSEIISELENFEDKDYVRDFINTSNKHLAQFKKPYGSGYNTNMMILNWKSDIGKYKRQKQHKAESETGAAVKPMVKKLVHPDLYKYLELVTDRDIFYMLEALVNHESYRAVIEKIDTPRGEHRGKAFYINPKAKLPDAPERSQISDILYFEGNEMGIQSWDYDSSG